MRLKFKTIVFLVILLINKTFAQDAGSFFVKGKAFYQQGKLQEADEQFSNAIKSDPSKAEFFIDRGKTRIKTKHYNEAILDFQNAEKIKPDIASYYLAESYSLSQNASKAVFYLENHLNSKYKVLQSQIKLDSAFLGIENTNEWKQLWAKEWYSKTENQLADAHFLLKTKEYTDALAILNDAISKRKSMSALWAERASVYAAMGQYSSAADNMDYAISLHQRNPEYYVFQSRMYMKMDKPAEAVTGFSKALSLDSTEIGIYLERGAANDKSGNYDQALADINHYLKFFPENDSINYLAGLINFHSGNYIGALQYLNKVLKKDQTKAYYFITRGNTYLKTKTYKYASRDFSMALDLEPQNSEAYLNKGKALYYSGDLKGACADWQSAMKYGNREAVVMLQTYCK
jgi:tetratricopeptide (TPR) repeat protein